MSITPQERQWGRGLVPSELFQLSQIWENPFLFVSSVQVHFSSDLSRFGVEPGGAVGGCPLCELCPVPILQGWDVCDCCNRLMDRGRGMFSVLWQLLALCVSRAEPALQLGSTTAARSEISPTVFGQVLLLLWFTLSPPRLTIAKGTLAKGEHDC